IPVLSAASPSGCAGSGSGTEESPVDTCLVTALVVTRCTMRQELHVSTTMRSGSTRLTVRQSGCTDQHCWRKAPLRIISAIDHPHTQESVRVAPFPHVSRFTRQGPRPCLERPKGYHHQHTNKIWERTRVEHCRPCTARRRVARQLLLVDEFTGENEHGENQRQRPTGLWPGVGTTEDEVRRKISTEEKNQRRQNEPD